MLVWGRLAAGEWRAGKRSKKADSLSLSLSLSIMINIIIIIISLLFPLGFAAHTHARTHAQAEQEADRQSGLTFNVQIDYRAHLGISAHLALVACRVVCSDVANLERPFVASFFIDWHKPAVAHIGVQADR